MFVKHVGFSSKQRDGNKVQGKNVQAVLLQDSHGKNIEAKNNYPLVNKQVAIENGHRNSGFTN